MNEAKMTIYLVGGAVRDQLLELPIKERDWVVVGSTPADMLKQGFRQVGKDFPVFIHPQTGEEYALARTERKQGRGYTGFTVDTNAKVTLEEDLLRRDLTINAIAMNQNHEIIDPYRGYDDLQKRILRHLSPAFVEDPLRVLRVARFYARFYHLGFRVADETLQLMREIAHSGELTALTPERVWRELEQALNTQSPEQFFWLLRDCDALSQLFPELHQLFGIPNPAQWHPEIDSGLHTLMVLAQAAKLSADPVIRFSALLHDLGKAVSPSKQWPHHYGHERAGITLIEQFCERFRIPQEYRDTAKLTSLHHQQVHQCFTMKAKGLLNFIEKTDALRRFTRFEKLLITCEADHRGRLGLEKLEYPQRHFLLKLAQELKAFRPNIDDMKEKSGEQIKDAIRKARLKFIDNFLK